MAGVPRFVAVKLGHCNLRQTFFSELLVCCGVGVCVRVPRFTEVVTPFWEPKLVRVPVLTESSNHAR